MGKVAKIYTTLNDSGENRESFLERLTGLSKKSLQDIDYAYDLAKESHRTQRRDGGERYFEHVRNVALILIDECQIKDEDMIITALLHDSIEDAATFGNSTQAYKLWTKTARYRIGKTFNPEVAEMVIALTKPKIDGNKIKNKQKAEELYLKNLSKSPDKVLIIKLCDRLHNLRTIKSTPLEKQNRKIEETKEKYLPLFKRKFKEYQKPADSLIKEIEKIIRIISSDWAKYN